MNPQKGVKLWLALLCSFLYICPHTQLLAQNEDLAKGPFFIVKAEDAKTKATTENTELLPLKSTDVKINIAGVVADISITQEYINTGNQILEAIYIFPASTRAAVYDLKMSIGERTLKAKIKEKHQARMEYEQAKFEGKTATLLEQHRPNVFQMSVGHILPKDKIIVTLKYTELLIPEEGVYELAFPTVVAPRYADDFAESLADADTWVNTPYLAEGEKANYEYHIQTNIQGGMAIHQVTSPSHKIKVDFDGKDKAKVMLDPSETNGGTKDYILRYRLGGHHLNSGLLLFEGEKENFFLAMIQPPQQVEKQQMPPREFIFLMDVSGSMRGFPLDICKQLMTTITTEMRPQDRFNIMLFESGNLMLAPKSVPANKANIAAAMDLMNQLQGGGGTELLPALKAAMKLEGTEGYSRSFVVITDGLISVEQEVFDLIRKNLGKANVFAIGAGSSVNRFLIEGIARSGQGEPLVVTTPEEVKLQTDKFTKYISTPALTNISVDFGGAEVYDVSPLSFPDVLAERPVIVYGKYKGKPSGALTLKGNTGEKDYQQAIAWTNAQPSTQNQALRYLWARNKIAMLNDYTNLNPSLEMVRDITRLGIDYNLLTNYTSFVAVDEVSRDAGGQEVSVKQPLPLPKGMQGTSVQIPPTGSASNRAPGSVVRGVDKSKASFRIPMPEKQAAFASKVSIAWTPLEAGTRYTVVIKSLMGDVLWEQETQETVVDIDLSDKKFADVMGRALLVSVESKVAKKQSPDIILEVLQGQQSAQFMQKASSLLLAKDANTKLELAKFYQSQGMTANALGTTREAIALGGGDKAEALYKKLMNAMGL